jgi:hypothetical protein
MYIIQHILTSLQLPACLVSFLLYLSYLLRSWVGPHNFLAPRPCCLCYAPKYMLCHSSLKALGHGTSLTEHQVTCVSVHYDRKWFSGATLSFSVRLKTHITYHSFRGTIQSILMNCLSSKLTEK